MEAGKICGNWFGIKGSQQRDFEMEGFRLLIVEVWLC